MCESIVNSNSHASITSSSSYCLSNSFQNLSTCNSNMSVVYHTILYMHYFECILQVLLVIMYTMIVLQCDDGCVDPKWKVHKKNLYTFFCGNGKCTEAQNGSREKRENLRLLFYIRL